MPGFGTIEVVDARLSVTVIVATAMVLSTPCAVELENVIPPVEAQQLGVSVTFTVTVSITFGVVVIVVVLENNTVELVRNGVMEARGLSKLESMTLFTTMLVERLTGRGVAKESLQFCWCRQHEVYRGVHVARDSYF